MAKRADRLQAIQDCLKNKNVVTVKKLAMELRVSDMTIRRDLSELEQKNVVEIFYGGVSLKSQNQSFSSGYMIENELGERKSQKDRIAKKAASLIERNDSILIDTGSTTGLIVRHMGDDEKNTVYCYSLNIMNELCDKPNLKVVACGGYFHRNTRMYESEEGAALLRKTYINKSFFAARGVTQEVGVTTAEPYEIKLKKAAISVSEKNILLVDSTKFGKAWYAKYADLSDIDCIITDDEIDSRYQSMIEQMGVELLIV